MAKFCLPVPNTYHGIFAAWICEIHLMDSGNVPFAVPGSHRYVPISTQAEIFENKMRSIFLWYLSLKNENAHYRRSAVPMWCRCFLKSVHKDSVAAEHHCGRHSIFKLSLPSLALSWKRTCAISPTFSHNSWIMQKKLWVDRKLQSPTDWILSRVSSRTRQV